VGAGIVELGKMARENTYLSQPMWCIESDKAYRSEVTARQ
jgi:hypothetical protein